MRAPRRSQRTRTTRPPAFLGAARQREIHTRRPRQALRARARCPCELKRTHGYSRIPYFCSIRAPPPTTISSHHVFTLYTLLAPAAQSSAASPPPLAPPPRVGKASGWESLSISPHKGGIGGVSLSAHVPPPTSELPPPHASSRRLLLTPPSALPPPQLRSNPDSDLIA